VVFVANGAGDGRSASQNLSDVVAEARAPIQVQTFAWSTGYKRFVADQADRENHLAQGRKLAAAVLAYRDAYPNRRIYLLGQSAGGAVVLAAAEALPPGSIDRIILLSPSVCTGRDLRPALAASRAGIDHFYSNNDRWVLGLGMRIVGTTEGDCRVAAGRVGFTPIIHNSVDAALYAKLRQHAWDANAAGADHDGRHFGNLEPRFLREYVLPLLGG
jgi:pimeloyl-ACP methyl ester carboxylesterase